MKPWLPVLVDTLAESPILALSTVRHLARAAVFDAEGELRAGGLGSPPLLSQAAEEARLMEPGECRLLAGPVSLTLERVASGPKNARFWTTALRNQDGAWASWLLTMPRIEDGALKLARHLISAFGPWTTPRLPEEFKDQWSLVPLKAGLGRLYIFGDDALALETAALASRAGLTVTWLTAVDQSSGPELAEARAMGSFELITLANWGQATAEHLVSLGLTAEVQALVTTPSPDVLQALEEIGPAYLAASGEAEAEGAAPGLFTRPVTTPQKALGLVAELLR